MSLCKKDYVVWYKGGGGGFIVSWLLQVAIDHTKLPEALDVFPISLKFNSDQWKKYEKTPHNVGLLCNLFHVTSYYNSNLDDDIRKTLNAITQNGDSLYDLLQCRIKFYLTNYVYQSGHHSQAVFNYVKNNPKEYKLDDPTYIKEVTDILFDIQKNIFIVAPEEYLALAAKNKKCMAIKSNVTTILKEYPQLKTFNLESIWKGTYVKELEKVLERKLTSDQTWCCKILIDRYIEIMPEQIKKYCYEN